MNNDGQQDPNQTPGKTEGDNQDSNGSSQTTINNPGGDKKESKAKTVEVKKEALDELISAFKSQQEIIKDQGKQIEMLIATADKRAMARYQTAHGEELTKTCLVSLLANRIIVGWKMVKDEVFKDVIAGVWRERQIVEVTTEDGKSFEMSYPDFAKIPKDEVLIMGKSEDTDKNVTFNLKFPPTHPSRANEEFKLDSKFLN